MKNFPKTRPWALDIIQKINLVILILATAVTSIEQEDKCPPMEDAPLCWCDETFRGIYVSCIHFLTPSDLATTLSELSKYSISGLEINHVSLMYLPSGLFRSLPIRFLSFRTGEILGLQTQDGDVMFQGVTDALQELSLREIKGVNSWRWKPLASLKNLELIDIRSCDVESVTSDFSHISPKSLKEINLMKNKIGYLDKNVFSSFPNLIIVDLAHNFIEALNRSMFPRPATKLKFLYLSNNKISRLPVDLFTDMPHLVIIDLSQNNIQWFDFKSLLSISTQLKKFDVVGNDIFCCSDMVEIVGSTFQDVISGECERPHFLKGRSIKHLVKVDLHHDSC